MKKLFSTIVHSNWLPLLFALLAVAAVAAIVFGPIGEPPEATPTPAVAAATATKTPAPTTATSVLPTSTATPTVVTDPAVLDGHLVTLTYGEDQLKVEDNGKTYIVPSAFVLAYTHVEDPEFPGLRKRELKILAASENFTGVIHLEPRDRGFFVTIAEQVERSREEEWLIDAVWYLQTTTEPAAYNPWLKSELGRMLDPDQPESYSPAGACRLLKEYAWMLEDPWRVPDECEWDPYDPQQTWAEFRGVYGAEQFTAPDGNSAVIVLFTLPEGVDPVAYLWCEAETPAPMKYLYQDYTKPLDLPVRFTAHWMVLKGPDRLHEYPLPEDGWVAFGPAVTDETEFDIRSYKIFAIGNWRHELDCTTN